jgi:osomolarity two-component system sensor histidine kinase TcsA
MNVNEQYMRLIESIHDYAIFLLNPNGIVTHWNESARRLNGYEEKEIVGQHFSIFYTKEDREKRKPELEVDAVTRLGRVEDESYRVRKDGTMYWANVVITAIRDESGTLQGMGKIVRDLTERRKSELSLEAAKVRTQFLTNISHEVRTPLNSVVSVGQLLKHTEPLTSHQVELIDILNDSSQSLIRLINDILDFEKFDKTDIQLSCDVFDPVYEIQKVMRKYDIRKEKNLVFETKYDKTNTSRNVIGDLHRFRQIIGNLIDNAYKFTAQGSIVASITYNYHNSGQAPKLLIEIQDSGIGVEKKDFSKLFQLFSQVDAGNKKRFQGTGLGLAICKMLVETMGGEINIDSEVSVGTKFYFTIAYQPCDGNLSPKCEVSPHNTSPIKKLNNSFEISASLLAPNPDLKILIAEDNLLNQKVLRHILHKLGYSFIETVSNGEEAVSKALALVYDVILMDVQMPIMDGMEATLLIKRSKPASIIIAMTAGVSEEDKQLCLQAGMDIYFPKPINIKALFDVLKELEIHQQVFGTIINKDVATQVV